MHNKIDNYVSYCLAQHNTKFKAMFGGTGLFYHGAMFVLVDDCRVYLRGGECLNDVFDACGCQRLKQIKKTVSVTVDYFDVTELFYQKRPLFYALETSSKKQSRLDKARLKKRTKRIRDLPNMRLTLERMVKKVGIHDIEQFYEAGAPEIFSRIQSIYGQQADDRLLLKIAGAIEGVHWELVSAEEIGLREGMLHADENHKKRPCQ